MDRVLGAGTVAVAARASVPMLFFTIAKIRNKSIRTEAPPATARIGRHGAAA